MEYIQITESTYIQIKCSTYRLQGVHRDYREFIQITGNTYYIQGVNYSPNTNRVS